MAPLTSVILTGLSLLSSTHAVKLLVTHFSGPVYTLDLSLKNSTSGTLSIASQTAGCGVTPTWLYLDQSTRTVYCMDESWQGSGVLTQYSIAAKNVSALTVTGTATTTGNSVYGSLYGGKDGKGFIITAEYSPSTITTYKLPVTNATKPIQMLEFTQAKPGPRPDRQEKPHPHAAFTDPSGKFMIVPDLGADLTRIFKIDAETGLLASCPAIPSLPGDGPRHGVFHRVSGKLKYYSLNEVSSSVGVYDVAYPATRGHRHTNGTNATDCLSLIGPSQTLSNYGPNVPLGNVTVKSAELRIAGPYLYASNRNDTSFGFEQDSIAQFRIDAETGKLSFVRLGNSYGYYPRSFAINRAGDLVAIGGQTTANIAVVRRDTRTGEFGRLVANIVLPPRGTYGGEDGVSSVVWDE